MIQTPPFLMFYRLPLLRCLFLCPITNCFNVAHGVLMVSIAPHTSVHLKTENYSALLKTKDSKSQMVSF
jgi:hypothetical protein